MYSKLVGYQMSDPKGGRFSEKSKLRDVIFSKTKWYRNYVYFFFYFRVKAYGKQVSMKFCRQAQVSGARMAY